MIDAATNPGGDVLAYLSRLARALTGQDKIEVDVSGDGPRVHGNRIVLPAELANSGASLQVLTGYVDLLAARARFSDPDEFASLPSPVARRLAQAIDDRRACARLVATYPGAASYFAALRVRLERDVLDRWSNLDWKDKLVWRVERFLWDEKPTATESDLPLNAALGAGADVLAQARMATCSKDSVHAALAFVERIRALAARDANNMMFTARADDTPDGERATNECDSDEPSSAHDPSSSDASPVDSGTLAQTRSDAATDPSGEGRPRALGLSPQNRSVFSVAITTQFDRVTDLTGKGDWNGWRALRSAARAQTEPLKARLERALKADEQTRCKREQERGELDRPSLVKLATSPGYRTPFKVRRVKPGRDAAISVLIDRSGSMAGRKIELATLCAAALADALSQLGFASEVLGYSSIEDPAMREFHQRWLAGGHSPQGFNRFIERLDLQIYKRFDSDNLNGLACIECGHENPDGEALSWAATRLLDHRAHRHILMVLSDGYPATGDGNPIVLQTDLRARIQELRARGIELIGVGVLDDAVRAFYPTSCVVEHLQDLPGAAFDLLGRTLLAHRDWMLEFS